MTDEELTKALRWKAGAYAKQAADRIEALTAENKRLGQQCEGLMRAGMNNGQALILAEAKLAKAVEALEWQAIQPEAHPFMAQRARATLAEIKGEHK